MAIRVKHAPSAAAIGESAYTIGRGQKRERDRRFAADVYSRQRALDLQQMSLQIQAKRGEERHALAEDEFEFRKERDIAGRETAERRWEEEPGRQLQRSLQEQEHLRKNITWQYDESQKRAMAHIMTGIAWVRAEVAAGRWTAEQGEQAEQQLWQKYYSIAPLPVYDDQPKTTDVVASRTFTDITGARLFLNSKGDLEPFPGSISFKDYSKLYADTFKVMDARQDGAGNAIPVDPVELNERVLSAITRFSQIQGLAARTGEEQGRQQQQQEQIATEQQQEAQQAEQQAAVEALPILFNTLIKGQPKIGRKKKGETSKDKVYGEEAYNRTLIEAVARGDKEGIPRYVIKAEFDKWWDEQHDKERGQMFQKFGNRMDFKGASREAAPAEKIKMKAPDGEIYEVDRSEIKEAEKHGWVTL